MATAIPARTVARTGFLLFLSPFQLSHKDRTVLLSCGTLVVAHPSTPITVTNDAYGSPCLRLYGLNEKRVGRAGQAQSGDMLSSSCLPQL